jgi:N6-L-threonylcarbamoyladenine synthase/protein kinase Bud32
MLVIGIESTAHTASIGLVEDGIIRGFKSDSYRPLKGGINPRDAAEHHRTVFPALLTDLLEEQHVKINEVDKIAVSIGPGLGPSLKTGVELARYLSIKYSKILVPVNHGVGHLEISRSMSGLENPIFLYVSGGNTQLITIGNHRYSVLGETLDIGVGNFLDKIARDLGIPFPGAPVLENLARKGEKVLDCPYTVKGMDVSYSGLYTYLRNRIKTESAENIAFNAQEYSFTALAEIVERGMAHFGLREFTITGGVARNRRLRELLAGMAKMRGYSYYFPEDSLLSDNGAMIALAGYMSRLRSSKSASVEQADRVDSRLSRWIGAKKLRPRAMVGGESVVEVSTFLGKECIIKKRRGGEYRNREINKKINSLRMRKEVKLLHSVKSIGLKAPTVLYVDLPNSSITMTRINGNGLSSYLNDKRFDEMLEELGKIITKMHQEGMSHGDLNLGNVMIDDGIYIIDPSMGELDAELEDLGVDVHLMKESLSTLGKADSFSWFLKGYRTFKKYNEVMEKVEEIENRRRYT